MPKITIDKLAEMTQGEFSRIGDQLTDIKKEIQQNHKDVKKGQALILEAILGVPSKPIIARLASKMNDHEDRIEKIEGKLKIKIS